MDRVKQIWDAQEKAYHKTMEDEQYCHHESFRWGFEQGVDWAEKDMIERACKWLKERIDISYSVATNENGEPLADSYIDYAKKRLEAANQVIEEFRKVMEEE